MTDSTNPDLGRRDFVQSAAYAAALAAAPAAAVAAAHGEDAQKAAVLARIKPMHAANLKRLQDWIALPSIAADNLNYPQGPQYMIRLAQEAGFADAKLVPTSGKPGVFGTIDVGARETLGVYFMYDVKQFDPAEWSSPPLEARLVNKEAVGTICVGRGSVNQKGPQNSFLSALMAFKAAGVRLPVNVVLVCEGEEEIGSPNILEVTRNPEVQSALGKCRGVCMPSAGQNLSGGVTVSLGAKGIVELEMVASAEKWGRGPARDIHSSRAAQADSPAWRLVQALHTLIASDGHTPVVDGFFDKAKPLSAVQEQMVREYAARTAESNLKKELGVGKWLHDASWVDSLLLLESQPTINIEGLVSGHTGPGGKTILPHKAVAKIDMRLVPDMTAADTLAKLKAHLAARGFGDIEVNMTGGYNPTQTDLNSKLVQTQLATYRKLGVEPQLWPRNAGSWPGYAFTDPPLGLPAGHFGLGYGTAAHAPDEFYLIESANPKVQGMDGAVASFVEYLYALA